MDQPRPTEGELAILRVLWDRKEPCTVREVHDALMRSKDTAYTTVLKMMTIMADKGLVVRDESERSHRYAAVHSGAAGPIGIAVGPDEPRVLRLGVAAGAARARCRRRQWRGPRRDRQDDRASQIPP